MESETKEKWKSFAYLCVWLGIGMILGVGVVIISKGVRCLLGVN